MKHLRTATLPNTRKEQNVYQFQVYSIHTASNALLHFKDGAPAYITRRFDVVTGKGIRFLQEDFAQYFKKMARRIGILSRRAAAIIDHLLSKTDKVKEMVSESYLSEAKKSTLV